MPTQVQSYLQHQVEFVKLFMQVFSYEANRVAEEEYYLRKRTIYRASDGQHMGMSLHGDYGGKCYYYSTVPNRSLRINLSQNILTYYYHKREFTHTI